MRKVTCYFGNMNDDHEYQTTLLGLQADTPELEVINEWPAGLQHKQTGNHRLDKDVFEFYYLSTHDDCAFFDCDMEKAKDKYFDFANCTKPTFAGSLGRADINIAYCPTGKSPWFAEILAGYKHRGVPGYFQAAINRRLHEIDIIPQGFFKHLKLSTQKGKSENVRTDKRSKESNSRG